MARNKKSKIFDLFKVGFKITFFYKPTMEFGDDHYYIILDDVIELRIKIINNVAVIDTAMAISQSYIKPLFEKVIETIMGQEEITVIVSIMGDTLPLHQYCIGHGAPVIDDEQYVTVSKNFYAKWKAHTNDVSKYGFYVLSVSEDTAPVTPEPKEMKPVAVDKPIEKKSVPKKEPIPPVFGNSKIDKLKEIMQKVYPDMTFSLLSENILQCAFTPENTFNLEIVENALYIKDLMQQSADNMNLVKTMTLINTFEQFIPIIPDIFIVSVMSIEIHRICSAKGYALVEEAQKLPLNKLFKQAFHGFGTYKIVINN